MTRAWLAAWLAGAAVAGGLACQLLGLAFEFMQVQRSEQRAQLQTHASQETPGAISAALAERLRGIESRLDDQAERIGRVDARTQGAATDINQKLNLIVQQMQDMQRQAGQ